MLLQFSIHYRTLWGEQVLLTSNHPELALQPLQHEGDGHWQGAWEVKDLPDGFTYQYEVRKADGQVVRELAVARKIDAYKAKSVRLLDAWQSKEQADAALFASAFEQVIFKPQVACAAPVAKVAKGRVVVQFQLLQVRVPAHLQVGIVGNTDALGNWDGRKAVRMGNADFPHWSAALSVMPGQRLEYKYVWIDPTDGSVVRWEEGANRSLDVPFGIDVLVRNEMGFRTSLPNWKGTGVAMPVFSLRTEQSLGCGEFSDLKLLIDWAQRTDMRMVQILPVNDTIATYSWVDSYPYAAISVFALHPLYLNLDGLEFVINQKDLDATRARLNALPAVDYEAVLDYKLHYARKVYKKVQKTWQESAAFQAFFAENEHWLRPYAAFCYLRDTYKTANFNDWATHQRYDAAAIATLTSPTSKAYAAIAFYYYLQFHLDKQLAEAGDYARSKGVVLKGDIPIGIYRYSADAWVAPHLYNMDGQAGAPPDDFATEGQNWGFPTYDWAMMAQDGYLWWRQRFTQLSRYFDAFRIDHILGFFRIWETPIEQVEGIMGRFNPALPILLNEFYQRGVHFDYDRFCKPFITDLVLHNMFGNEANYVKDMFLMPFHNRWQLRPEYATQRQIQQRLTPEQVHLQRGLFALVSNVLFFDEPESGGTRLHPRIDLHKTWSYRLMDAHTQGQVSSLYNDYFYHRQEEFWREKGMTKLPAMKAATNMLICGEDLGMVPACVPDVMKDLGILSLEIQRMAKNPQTEFLQTEDIPYWSVCSPSTHDMSPLRLWWEEEAPDRRQRFYNRELGWWGEAPLVCSPDLAAAMAYQHLQWPAMWVVFPLQDILAMDGDLRHPYPEDERINIPAITQHYWRYRMHLRMEDLLAADTYNDRLRAMIRATGRG